jgi:FtsZ-binding cell division protein ZapB
MDNANISERIANMEFCRDHATVPAERDAWQIRINQLLGKAPVIREAEPRMMARPFGG